MPKGDFRSRQIGVVIGSLLIVAIALVFVGWIGALRSCQLLGIGVMWAGLTLWPLRSSRPVRGRDNLWC